MCSWFVTTKMSGCVYVHLQFIGNFMLISITKSNKQIIQSFDCQNKSTCIISCIYIRTLNYKRQSYRQLENQELCNHSYRMMYPSFKFPTQAQRVYISSLKLPLTENSACSLKKLAYPFCLLARFCNKRFSMCASLPFAYTRRI